MKTVFIITTREYPINNSDFKTTINTTIDGRSYDYISEDQWRKFFKTTSMSSATWKGVDEPVPILRYIHKDDTLFYVAPSIIDINTEDYYRCDGIYIRNIASIVRADVEYNQNICRDDYRWFLVAHDRDLNCDEPTAYKSSEGTNSDQDAIRYGGEKPFLGFFAFQHEDWTNRIVNGGKRRFKYDIYKEFIAILNKNVLNKEEVYDKFINFINDHFLTVDDNITTEDYNRQEDDLMTTSSAPDITNEDFIHFKVGRDISHSTESHKWSKILLEHEGKPIVTDISGEPSEENCKRYKNFLDSSIWFYVYRDQSQLEGIKQEIAKNKRRYSLQGANEYREFHIRMLANAKIKRYAGASDGHSECVSPFLFHSEQKLRNKIKAWKHEENPITTEILKYRWRILLVDDYANIPMRTIEDEGAQKDGAPNKLDIVIEEIGRLFGSENVTTDPNDSDKKIYVEYANSISSAKRKLHKNKYEIVLLDYLLGKNANGHREYSYELLKEIWDKEEEATETFNYKKGPHDRFYFMFISAFTTAVSERLLAEGWPRSKKFWYIGEGACPINTPYLFQYRLLHIMSKRIDDMGIYKLNGIQNDYDNSYVKKNIIEKIFSEDKDAGGIRSRANDYFHKVLSLLYHYKKMLDDYHQPKGKHTIFCSEESVIVTDFIMNNPNLGGLLEHLTQLVYLTAFGTVRQWPEMWEEYQFIKSVLGKIESIEKYIVKIKDNSI